mgnify:CR=1 FL=1
MTISLLLDENGIIAKSKDARTETKVSQIEDEVGMRKKTKFIKKESNQAQESADTMLANLISRKLLTEEEIDRDQELITIKKKDGIVIRINRESAYNNIHSSETALDDYEDFDYTIDNNNCIDCLIEKVKEILKHEKII